MDWYRHYNSRNWGNINGVVGESINIWRKKYQI
jgi:hypothetical protein